MKITGKISNDKMALKSLLETFDSLEVEINEYLSVKVEKCYFRDNDTTDNFINSGIEKYVICINVDGKTVLEVTRGKNSKLDKMEIVEYFNMISNMTKPIELER